MLLQCMQRAAAAAVRSSGPYKMVGETAASSRCTLETLRAAVQQQLLLEHLLLLLLLMRRCQVLLLLVLLLLLLLLPVLQLQHPAAANDTPHAHTLQQQ